MYHAARPEWEIIMSAKGFSKDEWRKIRRTLDDDPVSFGLPERIYGSAVLGSFNIRKLGAIGKRNAEVWRFLAEVCRTFDLLSVQEVMEDVSGLYHLKELMGPEFQVIVSDTTGTFPGESGLTERLAFIYNPSLVRRTGIVTDVSYDRTKVLNTLAEHNDAIHQALGPYSREYLRYKTLKKAYDAGERATKPSKPKFKVKMPTFLEFIRTPFGVGFEITGHPGTERYTFFAVNAHLYFGDYMEDRRQEAKALAAWLMGRVCESDVEHSLNFILMGDLNLDFNDPVNDRKRLEQVLRELDQEAGDKVNVSFPFLDVHPRPKQRMPPNDPVFRTNARMSETFDQIGFFSRDPRLRTYLVPEHMGRYPRGPDYGVFNFADLFSVALNGRHYDELADDEQKAFVKRFEHRVSDHMPLWLRLPLPDAVRKRECELTPAR